MSLSMLKSTWSKETSGWSTESGRAWVTLQVPQKGAVAILMKKGRFEVDLSQWVKSKRGAIARKGNLAIWLLLRKSTKSVLYKWNHDATRTDVPIKQVSTIYAESIQTKTWWWGQWQTCRSCVFKCSPSCVDSPLKLKTIEGISPLCSKYKSNLEARIWRQLEY